METFSALLAICAWNSPAPGEFPAQMTVTRSFDVFFDLFLNKRFRKQSCDWWFETLSRPLWRRCNGPGLHRPVFIIMMFLAPNMRQAISNHHADSIYWYTVVHRIKNQHVRFVTTTNQTIVKGAGNQGPPLLTWISNYIFYKMWDEVIYPFPNFIGCTVEVWEWLSNFISHLSGQVITYPCRDWTSSLLVSKGGPGSVILCLHRNWRVRSLVEITHIANHKILRYWWHGHVKTGHVLMLATGQLFWYIIISQSFALDWLASISRYKWRNSWRR